MQDERIQWDVVTLGERGEEGIDHLVNTFEEGHNPVIPALEGCSGEAIPHF